MPNDFQISTLNMLTTNAAFNVTEGIAYDAPYLYVAPHNNYLIAKIDTRTFTIVDTLDLSKVNASLTGMLGCFIAGGSLYILPHMSNTGPFFQSDVVRVDLSNFTPAGCSTLAVLNASQTIEGLNGLSDGINGYINVQSSGLAMVTRFGLGANFNSGSVSTVAISTIEGFPLTLSNLVAVDETNIYSIAMVITKPSTGGKNRHTDLWLITIPKANFTAKAASFQRLTNLQFVRNSLPIAIDDGENLWVPPIPIVAGPLTGKTIGTMKIPKANPAAVVITETHATSLPSSTVWNSGIGLYDGWRYGYFTSNTALQIIQIDTRRPGTVNYIDISASCGGYPMYGLGTDGKYMYAVSFNGGAGLCLRFLPTQPHQGDDDDDDGAKPG